MSPLSLDALSPRQRRWVDAMMGTDMHVGPDLPHNAGHVQHGRVVDYKLDVAGVGVWFVLDRGRQVPALHRYVERYRLLPRP